MQKHETGVRLEDPDVDFYTPSAFQQVFKVSHKKLGLTLVEAPSTDGTIIKGIPVLRDGQRFGAIDQRCGCRWHFRGMACAG
jgi:hypothetical protein